MFISVIADLLDPALLPKGIAICMLFYNGGFSIGPLIVGYFSPHLGIASTLIAMAIAAGSSLMLVWIFYWIPFYQKLSSRRD